MGVELRPVKGMGQLVPRMMHVRTDALRRRCCPDRHGTPSRASGRPERQGWGNGPIVGAGTERGAEFLQPGELPRACARHLSLEWDDVRMVRNERAGGPEPAEMLPTSGTLHQQGRGPSAFERIPNVQRLAIFFAKT